MAHEQDELRRHSAKKMNVVKNHLSQFGARTTFGGLMRLITARSRLEKVFWIMFLLLAIFLFSGNLYFALVRYLRYEVSTKVTVSGPDERPVFPDVSICLDMNMKGWQHIFDSEKETGLNHSTYYNLLLQWEERFQNDTTTLPPH